MKITLTRFILACIALLAIYSTGMAQPSCSGAGCQGQNPVSTGCSADGQWLNAVPLNLGGVNVGYVQFIYSPTCGTVWSRISTDASQSAESFTAFLKYGGGLNTQTSFGTPYYQAGYSFLQVIDTSKFYHRDSNMLHVSDTRFINQGVKAYGTVGTTFINKFTPPGSYFIKPGDLP